MEVLGIPEHDILLQELRAGVLKPSYILTRDESLQAVVLAVRGTHSFKDAFTSLTGASKPHHIVDSNGVVLGYSHFGMLAAARWLKDQVATRIEAALRANPGYQLYIIGHSLGGGTAAMLTMMLRESGGIFSDATCTAIACPACMTLELAKSCSGYVTTVVHCTDVIPTISPGSADVLRDEVAGSSWTRDLGQDLRANRLVRAVETGIRGVSSATATATTWTATRLSACYQRRRVTAPPPPLPSPSDNQLVNNNNSTRSASGSLKRRTSDGAVFDEEGDDEEMKGEDAAGPTTATAITRLRRGASIDHHVTIGTIPIITSSGINYSTGGDAPMRCHNNNNSSSAIAVIVPPLQNEAMDDDDGGEYDFSAMAEDGLFFSNNHNEREGEDDDDAIDEESVAALGIGSGECTLEAEVSVRLREVAQAVSAAESEEAAAAAAGRKTTAAVPSIIRPGSYGGAEDGGPSLNSWSHTAADVAWRRKMYPAGRIMHLVPARLVPGLEWGADVCDRNSSRTSDSLVVEHQQRPNSGGVGVYDTNNTNSNNNSAAWPEAVMEEGDDYPVPYATFTGNTSFKRRSSSTVVKESSTAPPQPPGASNHSRHISELSLKDMVASEEAAGSAAPSGGGAADLHGPLPPLKPPIGPPPEPMVLLDGIPQEAYGRIKLCRTALSDHVIPNYLRSLASFTERL